MNFPSFSLLRPNRAGGAIWLEIVLVDCCVSRQAGLGFSLVPWQPVLDQRIGQHISGVVRGNGIEWDLGRKLGLGL